LRADCSASPGPRSAGCSPRARLATFTVTAPSRGRHCLRDSGPLGRRWRHASLARPPRRAPRYGTAVDTGRTARSARTVVSARPGLRTRRPLSFAPSRPWAWRKYSSYAMRTPPHRPGGLAVSGCRRRLASGRQLPFLQHPHLPTTFCRCGTSIDDAAPLWLAVP
jgi:hypothetical protein